MSLLWGVSLLHWPFGPSLTCIYLKPSGTIRWLQLCLWLAAHFKPASNLLLQHSIVFGALWSSRYKYGDERALWCVGCCSGSSNIWLQLYLLCFLVRGLSCSTTAEESENGTHYLQVIAINNINSLTNSLAKYKQTAAVLLLTFSLFSEYPLVSVWGAEMAIFQFDCTESNQLKKQSTCWLKEEQRYSSFVS